MNSNKRDDDDEDDRCPICYDTFHFPKLLACRHTFCQSCLEHYHGLSEEPGKREAIRCPLCRLLCALPTGGIPELSTNFFATDIIIQSSNRSTYHGTEDGLGRENVDEYISSNNDDDNETESTVKEGEDVVQLPTHCLLQYKPYTKYVAKLSLKCTYKTGERGRSCITSLCPTRDNQCYIVKDSSASIFKLDAQETVRRLDGIVVPDGIQRVVERYDGSLFLLLSHAVLLTSGFIPRFSLSAVGVVYTDMDLFPDGKIVVIGHLLGDENAGVALFFSETGEHRNIFKKPVFNPKSVAVNPENQIVYICDVASRCIDLVLQSGQLISTFCGEMCSFSPSQSILPIGICCDTEGNIMFIDRETNSIYVLNSQTELVGVILTTQTSGLGDPNVVTCCKDGSIIIGDRFNGNIKKYRITEYANVF